MKRKNKKMPYKYRKIINELKWEKMKYERECLQLREELAVYEQCYVEREKIRDLFDSIRFLVD